ncbi:hypothetical protein [Actinoplanes sp. NPDC051859]|uniref:hypothetical protein n=1 Tax=Actinoplanes sp. NPDC051859 TaxID=3363909 RepID=UPI0037B5A952
MNSRFNLFVRAAAASALAAGSLAAFGAPARAADNVADLELTITGTKIAATSSGKVIKATIKNHGPNTAVGTVIVFDSQRLISSKVKLEVLDAELCEVRGAKFACIIGDIASGVSLDLPITLTRLGGTGNAGKLVAAVAHEGKDPNEENDATNGGVDVEVGVSGPDLYAQADDVEVDANGAKKLVAPGGIGKVNFEVGNQGDVAVDGVTFELKLPEHVTFAGELDGCTYDAAKTVATCKYDKLPLAPADQDKNPGDNVYSAIKGFHTVKVAENAPSPKDLTGTMKVDAILAAAPAVEAPAAPKAIAELPEGLVGEKAEEAPADKAAQSPIVKPGKTAPEVDKSDNSDQFVVFVGKTNGGGGSDKPVADKPVADKPAGTDNQAGGSTDGGGLPVTGAKAGLIGGAGLAVVAVGGFLMISARRRRVVLVTPGDEKSAL